MPPTNSPLGPWPAAIGKKDNAVVAVAAARGYPQMFEMFHMKLAL